MNQSLNLIDSKYKKLVMLAGISSVSTAILLIVLKFFVWFLSGSSAILASLTDSLVDCMASLINLLALRFALTPADDNHRFGHYKAESLASLSQAAFIGGSAALLIFHGIERFKNPIVMENLDIAIYVSIFSIFITLVLVAFQSFVYKKTKSQAIGADRYHYLSDVILNLGVILALVLSNLNYLWADGFFAVALGLFILKGSYHIGREAISTLLDRSLPTNVNQQIMSSILSVDGVISIHDLKTRQAGPQVFIQCHIVINGNYSLIKAHEITNEAEKKIELLFPDADITMHMEPDDEETFNSINFVDHKVCSINDRPSN